MADTAKQAAQFLKNKLIEWKDIPVLLLASGGSAIGIFSYFSVSDYKNVTLGLLDERISSNPIDRNATSLPITFPIRQDISVTQSGEDYNRKLHAWKDKHPEGKILIIQGIGEDGHTAGMMPGYEQLFSTDKWAVGYDCTGKNKFPLRVTVTNTFLKNAVDCSLVYALGPKKQSIIEHPEGMPAEIITHMKEVVLFTDSGNAVTLTS